MLWIEKTIDYYVEINKPGADQLLSKIILGLPFHGLLLEQTSGEPKGQELTSEIYNSVVMALSSQNLKWDKITKEHSITFNTGGKEMLALYPSRKVILFIIIKKFLNERVKYAIKMGLAGVSIWEITKGLETFMDEF